MGFSSWLIFFPLLIALLPCAGAQRDHGKDTIEEMMARRNLQPQKSHHAAHRRPLRMGKKNRHNNLRIQELKQKKVDEKKGEGRYKDMLDQDIEVEPSFLINDPLMVRLNDSHPPSVLNFDNVTTPGKFSIISMVVEHHSDTRWMIPSYHHKYSAGWNRTMEMDQYGRVLIGMYIFS